MIENSSSETVSKMPEIICYAEWGIQLPTRLLILYLRKEIDGLIFVVTGTFGPDPTKVGFFCSMNAEMTGIKSYT